MKRLVTSILAPAILCLAFQVPALAQNSDPTRYGGSHRTRLSSKGRVLEDWTDSSGVVKETHLKILHADDPQYDYQAWRFAARPDQNITIAVCYLAKDHDHSIPGLPKDLQPGWYEVQTRTGTPPVLKPFPDEGAATKAAVDFVARAEKQFAEHGTVPELGEVETTVEQPALPGNLPQGAAAKGDQPAPGNEGGVEQPALPTGGATSQTPGGTCVTIVKVPAAKAEELLNQQIKHVQERTKAMTDAYYYQGASDTLTAAFKAGGVGASMDKAGTWGKSGIGAVWTESAESFYKHHLLMLQGSLDVIKERGYSTEGELRLLADHMKSWDTMDQGIESQFRALVNAYTAEAKAMDADTDYLTQYGGKLARLQSQNPYPADAINALNSEMYAKQKDYDARIKKMEDVDQQKIRDSIEEMGKARLFESVQKVPGC